MKKKILVVSLLAVGALALGMKAQAADSAFEAEKAKAMANPYANDLGPDALPADVLATYPKPLQDAYNNVLQVKCAKCHTAARPLNSQFVEPKGKRPEKEAQVAALKKNEPDLFADENVWKLEANIWQRYVKRMMAKPGCEISKEEGKAVWKFLVYDGNRRKLGKSKAEWKAQRTKMLKEFKEKYPEKYEELYDKKH